MEAKDRIIAALDVDTLDKVGGLVGNLSPFVGGFKIGMQLATSVGVPQAVEFVHGCGGKVFLDQKFKDIPNTVAGASAAAARLGVLMFNLHIDGGSKMMKAAMEAVNKHFAEHKKRPFVLGVTVLTSMDAPALEEIGYYKGMSIGEQVSRLAVLAHNSGLDGVIASAREAEAIRKSICDNGFLIITPAIRPEWADWAPAGDQARPTTHVEAVRAGADYIVIGRPLLRAPNPVDAAKRIAEEISQAL